MIVNTSAMIKINTRFKGFDIGFGPSETKNLTHILTEKDEQLLASKYSYLTYVPNKKKKDKPVSINTANTVKEIVENEIITNKTETKKELEPANSNEEFIKESPISEYVTKNTESFGESKLQYIDEIEPILETENIQLTKEEKKVIVHDENVEKNIIEEEEEEIEEKEKEKIKAKKKPVKKTIKKTKKKTPKKK